jgi:N-acetylglucosaminyldiphosphoundecaprenol N-acetyl-beta-D-mannosaminyltransferase
VAVGTEPQAWIGEWRKLLERLSSVDTTQQESQLLRALASPVYPTVLGFANAHAMNSAAEDAQFSRALAGCDVLLRDGSGLAILLRLLGQEPGLNLNGTDLIPKLLRRFDGGTIALFGTREPYLEQARAMVETRLAPQSPCIWANGFLPDAEYLRLARDHRPDLIVLGMGMPRQEILAHRLRATLTHPCLIVCGGAIIDFLGGKTPRAPQWMRASGLEWCYRLAMEPRRLFGRYVLGNPLFLARALRFTLAAPVIGRGAA